MYIYIHFSGVSQVTRSLFVLFFSVVPVTVRNTWPTWLQA